MYLILADSVASSPAQAPAHFPSQNELLRWCTDMGVGSSILLMLMGVVYLMYGYKMFKHLVLLNAALIGGYIGAILGVRFGGYPLAGGILGVIAAVSAAYPLMKWAVAVMGGICGAMAGAAVWLVVGLEPDFAWAGALTGLVGLGMLSFILFRGSIIMYTSLQGAMMLILGVIGLACKYQDFSPRITSSLNAQPMMLPLAVLIPAILGLIYQQTHAPAEGGGGDKKK